MEPHEPVTAPAGSSRLVAGLVIVAVGFAILLNALVVDVPWGIVLSAGLVLVGLILLLNPRSRSSGAWVAVGVILTGALVVTSLVGQPLGFGEPDNVEQADFAVTDPVERIVVKVDAGRVEILAGSGNTVEVERLLRFNDERPRIDHTVTGGVLEIEADCPGSFFSIRSSCSVDHLVRVPGSVDVEIDLGAGTVLVSGLDAVVVATTGSGAIELVDLGGRITAETGSGRVVLERVSGTADVSSGSGSIRGTDVRALQIVAETGSGSINLEFGTTPEEVELQTGSGSIAVAVPAGSYRLDLDTNSGSASSTGITDDASSPRTIRATTGSGSIQVTGEE